MAMLCHHSAAHISSIGGCSAAVGSHLSGAHTLTADRSHLRALLCCVFPNQPESRQTNRVTALPSPACSWAASANQPKHRIISHLYVSNHQHSAQSVEQGEEGILGALGGTEQAPQAPHTPVDGSAFPSDISSLTDHTHRGDSMKNERGAGTQIKQ